ncbi:MAG: hypothetical protein A2494_02095 [Candidatus Lloydbacteria bacterium RIFOXYC12_FULL_46_25]|uniref:DUF1653 domain-containing protein n=1 Tax=Candidatus Lloydbacteria bacterium RIFOXYC12_FULL_46_25 TaxID=1798670 RepID=A0A1G2DXT7_9BACT|nr:MAG: hypothetical protein A2494_02095 [Candidatus Lloydbacteria bacterium RIFOXYC12_FULL_46_25]
MDKIPNIPLGIYEHYKGGRYEVIEMARHSETLEPLVVYRALYGECALWVRPFHMFIEDVVVEGISVPRFRLIEEKAL